MASAIEDYALIGDCESAALVGKDGSIDWLCWPRLDSEACFAALLGKPENCRWPIAPAGSVQRVRRRYRPGTLILETEFETAGGTVALIDFMVGFLPADDPRVQGTVRAIERNLMADGLVRRYDTGKTEDGLPPGEGAFLACSFWYADNLVLAGRWDDACEMFERLLELRNDLGLLAEEYDPVARRQIGNFPQALSHLALVGTAQNLTSRHMAPAKQRSESAGGPNGPDSRAVK